MYDGSYYIYALKDPRQSPAMPFYIGKGTGARAWEHLVQVDETPKGTRIQQIQSAGHDVMVTLMVEDLSETQALKLESELIAAFGTERSGGLLTNSIMPSGEDKSTTEGLVVPLGVQEKAQIGLSLLKDAMLELAQANPYGIKNAQSARVLGLESDYNGGSKNYLSWSVLGVLMREGRIKREEDRKHVKHVAQVK